MMQDPHSPEGEDDDTIDLEEDDGPKSPKDILLSGVGEGVPPPMILDPVDGLPRPKDEGFVSNGVPAASDDNLVCTEGGGWVPFHVIDGQTQPADENALVLVDVASDQYPNSPPVRVYQAPGDNHLWVRARPACAHYVELETLVTDLVLEGHEKEPQTILRTCSKLNMVLTDQVLRACNIREPRDIVSEQRLIDRAREKAAQAKLGGIGMFREATAEERLPEIDPAKATSRKGFDFGATDTQPKRGMLITYEPLAQPAYVVEHDPLYVFFPDEAWQPKAEVYNGLRYRSAQAGKERVWSASLSGEMIIRQSPGIEDGTSIPDDLTGIGRMQWEGHVKHVAEALVSGRHVAMVPYHLSTQNAFVDAVSDALDALVTKKKPGKKAAPKKPAQKKKKAAPKPTPKKKTKTR